MKINREMLLNALRFARLGAATRGETLEQSNSFVFVEDKLITFNDEIMTQSPSPLDFTSAILADELLKIIDKMPDEELEVESKGGEVHVKGAKRSAGITSFKEISLPYDAVPPPGKWSKLGDGVLNMLQQAARTCGRDVTQELTTLVHVTPKMVEACDNWRLFRADMETGFPEECLLPAASVLQIATLELKRVSINEGWAHFRTSAKQTISIRTSKEKYHSGLDDLLNIGESQEVNLPKNLSDIVSRTVVMMNAEEEPRVSIKLKPEQLTVESRKDTGWYRERKRIKYNGDEMEFEVNPKFLVELLQRTHKVHVSKRHRIKLEADGVQFVVALVKKTEDE
jgi:hypothetical protein